ncbi:LytTR family transcriptional regulator DNA-binding domain-containing protein [[Eubacterium] hominis]|uniref:LytTR family transcriptional regulator DNA-binding domain-containing protein n=1 Tax=[Eubacterium] hominis TaxID=2764325 RepID=UPI003A4D4695
MIRLAILETEDIAKEVLFELMRNLKNREWSFEYFTRISEFARADEKNEFHIVLFHEKFDIPRITQTFVLPKTRRIVLYTESELKESMKQRYPYQRILYLDRKNIKNEIQEICPYIDILLKREEEYLFTYNHVSVPLHINDIFYIEKEEKYLIYHTKRGEFRERKNMKDAATYFEPYDFLWIHVSYLVNMQYITKIEQDQLYLDKLALPISRSKRPTVTEKMHALVGM